MYTSVLINDVDQAFLPFRCKQACNFGNLVKNSHTHKRDIILFDPFGSMEAI